MCESVYECYVMVSRTTLRKKDLIARHFPPLIKSGLAATDEKRGSGSRTGKREKKRY